MRIHTHIHKNSPTITPPSLLYFLFPSCFSMLSLSLEKLVTCGLIRSYNLHPLLFRLLVRTCRCIGQTGRRAKHSAWTSSIHAGISFSSPLVGKSSLGFDMAKPTAQIHIVGPHTLFKSLAHLEASIPMRWNPSMLFFGGRIASNDLPCRGFAWCFLCFWEPS